MDADFWLTRWEKNQLGFHQQKVNSRLMRFWESVARGSGAVFVPLCGKSTDMLWLAEIGHDVFGIEISDIACRDFFLENGLDFELDEIHEEGVRKFQRFLGYTRDEHGEKKGRIELWQGDFFALTAQDLASVRFVYDRASLVALPEDMRQRYGAHMAELTKPGDRILTITMEYDQSKMKGPPFSVPRQEVMDLFQEAFSVEIMSESSGPEILGNLSERGLDTLAESVYLLTRK